MIDGHIQSPAVRKRRNEGGFALLLALWVLVALAALVTTMAMDVARQTEIAALMARQVRAKGLAYGAVQRMAVMLAPAKNELDSKKREEERIKGEKLGLWLVDPKDWSVEKLEKPPGEGDSVICEVTAEDAKLSLNHMTKAMIDKLPDATPELIDAIEDLLKNKDPKTGLTDVGELRLIKGIERLGSDPNRERPFELEEIFTVFSDGKVYVNAVSDEVIRLIPGVDPQIAQALTDRLKRGQPFERVEHVGEVMGVTANHLKLMAPWIKVKPKYYRLRARAVVNGAVEVVEEVVKINGESKVETVYTRGG